VLEQFGLSLFCRGFAFAKRDVITIDARLGKDLRQASRRVLVVATPDTRIAAVKLIKTQGENVIYQLIISSTESSRAQQCASQVRRHFCPATLSSTDLSMTAKVRGRSP
jgi:hypothetical protein